MSARCLFFAVVVVLCLSGPGRAWADAGVLIPWSVKQEPDSKILAMRRMEARVRIVDLHAEVRLTQVFENMTDSPIEGRYVLPLGPGASVVGFALWEGSERRRGLVVEKAKGRRIFEELARRAIDPGLLEHVDEEEHRGAFAVRVAPIPPRATVRVEVTYEEDLPLVSLGAVFTLPLAPRRYAVQRAGDLSITVEVGSGIPLRGVTLSPRGWFQARRDAPGGSLKAEYRGRDVALTEDLTCEILHDVRGLRLAFLAYRDSGQGAGAGPRGTRPEGRRRDGPGKTPQEGRRQEDGPPAALQPGLSAAPQPGASAAPQPARDERGYFLARILLDRSGANGDTAAARPGRDVVLLLDTSLSLLWDKLVRSYRALEHFLGRLRPEDRFTVVLFNDEVRLAFPEPRPATRERVAEALHFVRSSYLMGGTDLAAALAAGLDAARKGDGTREKAIVVVTDGNPTIGEARHRELGAWFARLNRRADGRPAARLFVLGVGDDANTTLLETLARAADGFFMPVREGEEMSFKLRAFFEKLSQGSLREVTLAFLDLTGIEAILPARLAALFDGSDALFVGRYARPAKEARLAIRARDGEKRREEIFTVTLPEHDTTHPFVARLWARHRIDLLLERIAAEGERAEWVNEIVALAKRHGLATPYTSFLAASRATLRPRDIQPGDPVLRVKAAPDVVAVTALFPFGLVKRLDHVPDEGIFETRFVAPASMKEGTHRVTLILTDAAGRKRREEKSFVIDSTPPVLRLVPERRVVRPGERLEVLVRADSDTRRITLRVGDGPPAEAAWDPLKKASRAVVEVPDLPTGTHELRAVAEDFAHNVSSETATLTVVGR